MGVQLQLMNEAKRAREKTETPMADAEASPLAGGFGFSTFCLQSEQGSAQPASKYVHESYICGLKGKIGFKN